MNLRQIGMLENQLWLPGQIVPQWSNHLGKTLVTLDTFCPTILQLKEITIFDILSNRFLLIVVKKTKIKE
jgi:hypothetical protein